MQSSDQHKELQILKNRTIDNRLAGLISQGVSYHSAALSKEDRALVEKGFLDGLINVICIE